MMFACINHVFTVFQTNTNFLKASDFSCFNVFGLFKQNFMSFFDFGVGKSINITEQ